MLVPMKLLSINSSSRSLLRGLGFGDLDTEYGYRNSQMNLITYEYESYTLADIAGRKLTNDREKICGFRVSIFRTKR
jgi:hypothetical protein